MKQINWKEIEAFSANGEDWHSDVDCIYCHCEEWLNKGDKFTVYIGDQKSLVHGDFLRNSELACLVESMQEQAYESVGDIAEIYLENLATKDNEDEFQKLVADWIQKKTGSVNIWQVNNIREVECVWDGEDFKQAIVTEGE